MTHKERIEQYMLENNNLLEQFIADCEKNICNAPSGFTESVMQKINAQGNRIIPVPVLSRKLCAAVCFSSAAAIILFTVLGSGNKLLEFILNSPDKLSELLTAFKIF